jgi:hypothetical protein
MTEISDGIGGWKDPSLAQECAEENKRLSEIARGFNAKTTGKLTKDEFKVVVDMADKFILSNLPKDNQFYVGRRVRRLMANFAVKYSQGKLL